MPTDRVAELERRIRSYLEAAPHVDLPALAPYVRPRTRQARRAPRPAGSERYWIQLPQWLLASCRRGPIERRFLRDVLWGQYCLFLFVRIHDDLVDGQAHDRRLILIADDLLMESQSAFARHFHHDDFASVCRGLLGTSLAAILKVDALQANAGEMNAQQLHLYAAVSSIFKAGSAAVLFKCGERRWYSRVAAFCDHLAIAMQVLDDLFDIDQDLARGRVNFAANIVLDGGTRIDELRLARSVLIEDSVGRVVEIAREQLERAASVIAPTGVAAALTYIRGLHVAIIRYRDNVHRARVEHLLPGVPSKRLNRTISSH